MNRLLSPAVGALVVLLAPGFASPVDAKTFTCASGDVACLLAAIDTANANGKTNTIKLSAGVYTLTAAGTDVRWGPTGLPPIAGTLTIKGEGAESTIIERSATAPDFRLVTVAGTLTLDGVTLRGGGGESATDGGAILAIGSLTVTNSVITGSRARSGGGLELMSVATIANSTISGNQAIEGAGILVRGSGAVVTISECTVASNTGSFGGGVGVQAGGAVSITNCTFTKNSAFTGSAVNEGIAADAPVLPGAVPPGTATIANSTIVANNAPAFPFSGRPINSRGGTIQIKGTIIANNTPAASGDCPGTATSLGFNLLGNPVGCSSFLQATDLTGDPHVSDFLDDGTPGHGHYPLLSDSPAIDAGGEAPSGRQGAVKRTSARSSQQSESAGDCPATDQLGQKRQGRCDIGSIEFRIDTVTVRRARYDADTAVLFVSADSSSAKDDVRLFLSVAECLTDAPMLRLGRTYMLLIEPACGNLDNRTATVTSSGGGSATAQIR